MDKMKRSGIICLASIMIMLLIFHPFVALAGNSSATDLTTEEKQWLLNHKDKTLIMGVTPYAGEEFFYENGIEKGYLQKLVDRINEDIGTKIIVKTLDWKDMLPGLKNGKIDIVVGANETADRKTFMAFTEPIRKVPYALFSLKNGEVNTLADIDSRIVAFLEGDIVIDMMQNLYPKLKYNRVDVKSPEEAFALMEKGKVDAFVNSGDELAYELLWNHPKARSVWELETITSDMTLSTRLEDKILASILSAEIANAKKDFIPQILSDAKIQYIRKVIKITPEERKWLETDGVINAGVREGFLPFDYLDGDKYVGIAGMVVSHFAEMIGAKVVPKSGTRASLLTELYLGNIDTLCTAKSDEIAKNAIFPTPFYKERDMIYGKADSPEIIDVYGLDGKKIAVEKGSPQNDLLLKNLSKPEFIYTNNVKESIKAVSEGKADYMVENVTIAKYYAEELGAFSLVAKGNTSSDSYNYIAINRNKPVIESLFNKVLPLMNIEKEKRDGYQSVPHKTLIQNNNQIYLVFLGALILFIILAVPVNIFIFRRLLRARTEKEVLGLKENLLYIDSLTGLYNKNYFNDKLKPEINGMEFPQALIILDMNNLKDINDNFGHLAGDISLKVIGEIIKGISIKCDAFRFGGDEFLIVLYGEEADKGEYIQDRIDVLCENRMIDFPTGEKMYIKIASGYAKRESDAVSFEELFRDADRKMYTDKRYKKAESKTFDNIDGGK